MHKEYSHLEKRHILGDRVIAEGLRKEQKAAILEGLASALQAAKNQVNNLEDTIEMVKEVKEKNG